MSTYVPGPRLRALALDNGSDLSQWPVKDQREAVVELLEMDEAKAMRDAANWLGDILSDLGCDPAACAEMISALKQPDDMTRLLTLGNILHDALVKYPLDTLSEVCEQHIYEWRAEESRIRAERSFDLRREA